MWPNVARFFSFHYSISAIVVLREFLICNIDVILPVSQLPQSLYFCLSLSLSLSPGGGSVRAASSGYVSMESAGPSGSLHVFLATAVCFADLLLLQHERPAYLKGEAPFPFSYQVRP